jgi:hypothetical protein
MDDILARAACDSRMTPVIEDIAKDIENEIAITQCRRRILAVVAHLPQGYRGTPTIV